MTFHPPFGTEPNRVICDICGEIVMAPVRYNGLRLHKGCARKLQLQNYTEDTLSPRADEAQNVLEELLDSNPSTLV